MCWPKTKHTLGIKMIIDYLMEAELMDTLVTMEYSMVVETVSTFFKYNKYVRQFVSLFAMSFYIHSTYFTHNMCMNFKVYTLTMAT